MRSFGQVVIVALVVAAGGRAQVAIDNPKEVTLALTNQRQAFGEVTGVTSAGIAFRTDGTNAAAVQPWNLIRVARTKAADYTAGAKAGTLVRTDAASDPAGILPRVIGTHAATVQFQNGKVMKGRVVCLLPDEIGFQADGVPFALTFAAREVVRVELADAAYAWNAKTQRLERERGPGHRPPNEPPPPPTSTRPTDPPPPPPPPDVTVIIQQVIVTVVSVGVLVVVSVILLRIFKATIKLFLIVLIPALCGAMVFGWIGGCMFGQHGAAVGASIGFLLGALSGILAAVRGR